MQKHRIKKSLLSVAIVSTLSSPSFAESLYGTVLMGGSDQANDSGPYGENIAVDPDFPKEFAAGDGGVGALAIGYAYTERLRVETRIGYRSSDFDSERFGTGLQDGVQYILNGDVKSTTLTVEVFYDIPNSSPVTPYLKAGVGVSRNKYSARLGGAGVAAFDSLDGVVDGFYDGYPDQSSTEFSWTIGGGARVEINDRISLVGEYQYISLGDARTAQDAFTDGFELDTAAHEVLVGVQANF